MRLIEFLKKHDMTQTQFAELAKLTQASISRYATYSQKPDLDALIKIRTATNNQVDAEDFVRPNED